MVVLRVPILEAYPHSVAVDENQGTKQKARLVIRPIAGPYYLGDTIIAILTCPHMRYMRLPLFWETIKMLIYGQRHFS